MFEIVLFILGLIVSGWALYMTSASFESLQNFEKELGNFGSSRNIYSAHKTRKDCEKSIQRIIRESSIVGLATILFGIIVGAVAPLYLSTNTQWTVVLQLVGIILAVQLGLSLLLLARLRGYSIVFGLLGTAILLHATFLRTNFGDPLLPRLLVLIVLTGAAIGFSIEIFRPGTEEIYSESSRNWIRYTMGVLGAILTLLEFFNIIRAFARLSFRAVFAINLQRKSGFLTAFEMTSENPDHV